MGRCANSAPTTKNDRVDESRPLTSGNQPIHHCGQDPRRADIGNIARFTSRLKIHEALLWLAGPSTHAIAVEHDRPSDQANHTDIHPDHQLIDFVFRRRGIVSR